MKPCDYPVLPLPSFNELHEAVSRHAYGEARESAENRSGHEINNRLPFELLQHDSLLSSTADDSHLMAQLPPHSEAFADLIHTPAPSTSRALDTTEKWLGAMALMQLS